jgi:hypothetical protein
MGIPAEGVGHGCLLLLQETAACTSKFRDRTQSTPLADIERQGGANENGVQGDEEG